MICFILVLYHRPKRGILQGLLLLNLIQYSILNVGKYINQAQLFNKKTDLYVTTNEEVKENTQIGQRY